jgi:hypothetical protein
MRRLLSSHENPESGPIEKGADECPSTGTVRGSHQVQKQGLAVGFGHLFDQTAARSADDKRAYDIEQASLIAITRNRAAQ